MNSISDVRNHDTLRMLHIQGASQCIFTEICEKLHEIASFFDPFDPPDSPGGPLDAT